MKNYHVIIIAIACGSSAAAQTIINSGFEDDTFETSPGYISGALNGPITGWTASNTGRAGINPGPTSPFANNGAIPEGSQVAFLQGQTGVTTLTSASGITGLTAGKTYNLTYRVNSRGANSPEMGLVLGGSNVLRNVVSPVGGTNSYKFVSSNFVATSSSMSLALNNSSGSDQTLLLDAFTVTELVPRIKVFAWNDDATSGIDSSFTYTHAFNFGSGTNAVVNGQTFTGIGGGNPALAGSFSYDMGNAAADAGNSINSGGSATLADNFVFNNANATLSLSGLVDGQTYRTTVYTVGFDGSGYGRSATIVGPNGEMLTVDTNTFGNNNGTRVDIGFTASGTTANIKFDSLLSNQTFHTYGFANAEIAGFRQGVSNESLDFYEYNSHTNFEWDLAGNLSGDTGTRGVDYDAVSVAGDLTIESAAIFKVILGSAVDFADSFWASNQTWDDIFTAGSLVGGWDPNTSVETYDESGLMVNVSSYGAFTVSGTVLSWSAIPEPSSALAGILLGTGILVRRRNQA